MEPTINLVSLFVVNALWQAPVLLLLAFACSYLLKRAAASRKHLLWATILTLSVALPVLSLSSYWNADLSFGYRLPTSILGGQASRDEEPISIGGGSVVKRVESTGSD